MLDYLVLPLSIGVAATAAYTDWRTGKIPNRLLKFGLLFALEALAVVAVWLLLGGPGQSTVMQRLGPWPYAGAVLLNGALSFLISLLLWWIGVWAAGDAKLFSLLALSLPLGFYENHFLSGLPSFVLFFNTFFCLMGLLLLELLYKLARRSARGSSWRSAGRLLARSLTELTGRGLGVLRVIGGFIAIFMVIRVARHFTRDLIDAVVPMNRTLVYVVLFLLFAPLTRFFSNTRVFVVACGAIVAYIVYAFGFSDDPELRRAVVHIGWMSLSIVLLGWMYRAYTDFTEVRAILVRDVRPGMLLSEGYLRDLRENSEFNNERMGTQGPDGLSELQVETLLTWHVKNHPAGDEAGAELATTVPFAPAMFLAVILTVVLRGYVLLI